MILLLQMSPLPLKKRLKGAACIILTLINHYHILFEMLALLPLIGTEEDWQPPSASVLHLTLCATRLNIRRNLLDCCRTLRGVPLRCKFGLHAIHKMIPVPQRSINLDVSLPSQIISWLWSRVCYCHLIIFSLLRKNTEC